MEISIEKKSLRGTPPLSETEKQNSWLFWFSFVNVYEGVLYPRYKNQNCTGLDSSRKTKLFEAYDPEKNYALAEKLFQLFFCLWMVFHCLQQLKRVNENIFF